MSIVDAILDWIFGEDDEDSWHGWLTREGHPGRRRG